MNVTINKEYLVNVKWENTVATGEPDEYWNDACVWAMENFGLPNTNTYQVSFEFDYLIFKFTKEQDAILMMLRWS